MWKWKKSFLTIYGSSVEDIKLIPIIIIGCSTLKKLECVRDCTFKFPLGAQEGFKPAGLEINYTKE